MGWPGVWVVLVLSLFAMGQTCGMDRSEQEEGAPCTRTRDCGEGLVCTRGTCSAADASAAEDGGADDDGAGG